MWHNLNIFHSYQVMKKHHPTNPQILEKARSMRQGQTPSEETLWKALRNKNIAYKFRRQYPIEPYIIDFYCDQAKLCVEVDGSNHFEPDQEIYDVSRTSFLRERGYTLIRFTNDDVRYHHNEVISEILKTIEDLQKE